MYDILKRLFPRRLLLAFEAPIRTVIALFYRGDRVSCPICGGRFNHFIARPDDLMCPRCGSLSRNRRLFLLLRDEFLKPGARVLDFSPSRSLYHAMKRRRDIDYIASDFAGEFEAENAYDITQLPLANGSIDLLVCYHILEHVENDTSAIREMRRVLRSKGVALVQTPFKDGDIDEDPTVRSPEARAARFGQWDHVRTYSVVGLARRLEAHGFRVEQRQFDSGLPDEQGLSRAETVLIARSG